MSIEEPRLQQLGAAIAAAATLVVGLAKLVQRVRPRRPSLREEVLAFRAQFEAECRTERIWRERADRAILQLSRNVELGRDCQHAAITVADEPMRSRIRERLADVQRQHERRWQVEDEEARRAAMEGSG